MKLLSLSLAVLTLTACGSAKHSPSDVASGAAPASKSAPKVFALDADVPTCTVDLESQQIYVTSTKAFKVCEQGSWADAAKPDDFVVPPATDAAPAATPAATSNDAGTASETAPVVVTPPKPIEQVVKFVSDTEIQVCVAAVPGTYYDGATRLRIVRQDINTTGTPYISALMYLEGGAEAGHYSWGTLDAWDEQAVMDTIMDGLKLVQAPCPV